MVLHVSAICLGLLLITTEFGGLSSAAVPENDEALKIVSNTLNRFSVDFYKNLVADQPDNFICSPLSLSMVLSMVAFGARGKTAREMRSALHLLNDDSVPKSGFESLIDILNNVKKVNLQLANKVYIANDFEVKPEFKELTAKSFKSEIQNIDFSNAEAACSIINAWTSAKTNGSIKNLIQPDDVDQAAMVLVNAVHFKGNWEQKFEPSLTGPKPFYIDENKIRNVPMMVTTQKYNHGVMLDLDAEFVELPYAHEDEKDAMSMFIILPNTADGLKKTESNLGTVHFKRIGQNANFLSEIKLYIPKFKVESSFNLQPTLIKMRMERMFTNAANLTGIAANPSLKISKVLQKAFIEVNEEGSEAAAATFAVVMLQSSLDMIESPPRIFTIDKPFVYAIVHKSTNTILVQGHISDPVY